jgi:hypothetical protein
LLGTPLIIILTAFGRKPFKPFELSAARLIAGNTETAVIVARTKNIIDIFFIFPLYSNKGASLIGCEEAEKLNDFFMIESCF